VVYLSSQCDDVYWISTREDNSFGRIFLQRYYYAVVECDSSATANYLYKSCDETEFERSSNKLDLRFIPDSMEFKHTPQDIATEVKFLTIQ
jgi:hypothetical protein